MDNQDSRPERVTIMVSAGEKRAVRAVAAALGVTESDVMRDMTIPQVMSEYARIREAIGAVSRQPAA